MKFNTPHEFLDHWFNQCIPMLHSDHPDCVLHVYDQFLSRIYKMLYLKGDTEQISKLKPTEESIIFFIRIITVIGFMLVIKKFGQF